jgi:hypothetical protein
MMHASFWSAKGAETLSRRSARARENSLCREERKRGRVLTGIVTGGGQALRDPKPSCAQPGGEEE